MTDQSSDAPPASVSPPVIWRPHLSLGITGHRPDHPTFAENEREVRNSLLRVFETIETIRQETSGGSPGDVRLHGLLARGVDQLAAEYALAHDWQLVAPLPFGRDLNIAINAGAETRADVEALCDGREAADPVVEQRAAETRSFISRAKVFEIADRDEEIKGLLLASIERPEDKTVARRLQALASDNVGLAGRIMIERCDLLVTVWDGKWSDAEGGTGHTVFTALENGTPVLVIHLDNPQTWTILTRPEELAHRADAKPGTPDHDRLRDLVGVALAPPDPEIGKEQWRPKSPFGFGFYRRIETLFGGRNTRSGTVQSTYESPEHIAQGTAAKLLETTANVLGTGDPVYAKLRRELLPAFASADGISSRLSDAYRSGMTLNFALSAFAIIVGIAYLPFGLGKYKWIFATIELGALIAILMVTFAGHRRAWHRRWFETRRVAEYLRFAPPITVLGIARPNGRWPRGESRDWPERFSRDCLRDVGLPEARVDRDYLRQVLEGIVLPHVEGQRLYHEAKSGQLARVHHRIDRSAELCFVAAVLSVSVYLLIEFGAFAGVLAPDLPYSVAKLFTFLGVTFPTLGATLAGIRYFGDFERFSAISKVTATKLADIEKRIRLLLSGDPARLNYRAASKVVKGVDEIVISEIESWQSVFGAKHLGLPA
ncbi:MAG: hypothetical protein ACX930_10310 [Erythrobacter sp.]